MKPTFRWHGKIQTLNFKLIIMNVLIIEDEPLVAKDLQKNLLQADPAIHVIAILSSVESSRKWLSQNKAPDLILSDIQLSDGISFEIFEPLQLTCPIIFTTAYDQYAVRAFKLNSIDYVLKPVDQAELRAALQKYKSLQGLNVLGEHLQQLVTGWGKSDERRFKERFLASHRNTLIPVPVSEIAFFHKQELIYLHTRDNNRYVSEHHTLDEVEELIDPAMFYRVNRQYIIHIQTVARIKPTHKGLTVQLTAPHAIEIDISREKAADFKSWLG